MTDHISRRKRSVYRLFQHIECYDICICIEPHTLNISNLCSCTLCKCGLIINQFCLYNDWGIIEQFWTCEECAKYVLHECAEKSRHAFEMYKYFLSIGVDIAVYARSHYCNVPDIALTE
jgi:hypothetical protein